MQQWPSLKRPLQAPRQLLVEGRTPEIFFREWIEVSGLKGQMEVRDYGSIQDLDSFLKLFTSLKAFREIVTSVGIVRDAESMPASSAFESVCASLKAVGLDYPAIMNAVKAGTPQIGVFILPDGHQPGMLETLCWSLLTADPQKGSQLACVTQYMDCLRGAGVAIENETKARVWSFLAGLGQFDPQVGRAAQAKTWDWSSPAFKPLSLFLKSL